MGEVLLRPVWAEIDLDAVRYNAALLRRVAGNAALCAVVKADAYGHGAVPVARAALEGGATWLGVAFAEEGVELRNAGITAPVLVLSEPTPGAMSRAVGHGLDPTVYSEDAIASAEAAAEAFGRTVHVHLKVDTGMHRVGADPDDVLSLAKTVCSARHLRLGSVWTHLAVAEGTGEEDTSFTLGQTCLYDEVLGSLADAGIEVPMRHAANSAGALAHPGARYDMVRCGIALYGELPAAELARTLPEGEALRPVMSLKARVVLVRNLRAGARPSYGRKRALKEDSCVAVIPIGYADGVPRAWFDQGSVLVGGHPRPLAGTVTMDQIIIDCGRDSGVAVGDEVVLIGRQDGAGIAASDWATALGTISYEVLCGIGPRVPRVVVEHGHDEHEESR
jgi:alanine racemase